LGLEMELCMVVFIIGDSVAWLLLHLNYQK